MYIYLEELIFCMEPYTVTTYYDSFTGSFIASCNLDFKSDRHILIPKVDYKIILMDFLDHISDKRIKRLVLKKSDQKNFVSVFHRVITDNGLYDDYTVFSVDVLNDKAIEWCLQNNVKYTLKRKNKRKDRWD